jgi:hypothetical protein
MEEEIVRRKAFDDLRSVELPYNPGGCKCRVSDYEALYILDGYIGFDGVTREGCHPVDTVPMVYLRDGQIYTAPHIASIMRAEFMHSAARVALNSRKCMKTFIDYVWHTVGIPPKLWTYIGLYEHCLSIVDTFEPDDCGI